MSSKWWKCAACQLHSHVSSYFCGSCGVQRSSNVAAQSHDSTHPYPAPPYGNRWSRRRPAKKKSPQPNAEAKAPQESLSQPHKRLAALNKIISAMRAEAMESLPDLYHSLQQEHKAMRIAVTREKPLPEQQKTLQELVERKNANLAKKQELLVTAQQAVEAAQQELAEAQQQLAVINAQLANMQPPQPVHQPQDEQIKGYHLQQLQTLIKLAAPSHAEVAIRAINSVFPFLQMDGVTPTPSVIEMQDPDPPPPPQPPQTAHYNVATPTRSRERRRGRSPDLDNGSRAIRAQHVPIHRMSSKAPYRPPARYDGTDI